MTDIEITHNDLIDEFQTMADTIGLENTKRLIEKFDGTRIYFSTRKAFKKATQKFLEKNYRKEDGKANVNELAQKLNVSRNTIFNRMNQKMRKK